MPPEYPIKASFIRAAIFVILGLFFSQPPAAHASSPPADSVRICAFDDYEHLQRDHRRPAAKRLTDLNVGKPRTVRMIYFLPNGRSFRADVVDSMKAGVRSLQAFYADQMQAHGYGDKTFRFETDEQGEPMVHRVDDLDGSGENEIYEVFDLSANIYLIVIDDGRGLRGVASRTGKNSGYAYVQGGWDWQIAAHELGHTFGLLHDFRDGAYIMSYGPGRYRLSPCAAEFLAVHPYFNASIPTEEDQAPTIELISQSVYPAGSKSLSVQVKVRDPDGLHQVIFFTGNILSSLVKTCRGLAGERDTAVEFEYDGDIPSATFTSLFDPVVHPIRFYAVDTKGNVGEASFILAQISPYDIATLSGHTDRITSMAFSPDGTTLASGSEDHTVKLWDVETRKQIATLSGHTNRVASVAFSSNGRTLASGASDGIKLWDLATRESMAALGYGATSVSFSPDGATLASGSWDGTVRLWDVARREQIATLEGHMGSIYSVSFSPDGATLASGSWDGTVRLWDVARREQTAILSEHKASSLAFSPDWSTLAGPWGNTVTLWDLATGAKIANLERQRGGVTSVSFSPDGTTLASGTGYGAVSLWDVVTLESVGTLSGHRSGVASVSFSPDGATLASGSEDGTVKLWETSEWTRPRPFGLVKISGDDQQGPPGAALPHPLVVEVRDQYDNPVPKAQVTFTVTSGEGRFSGRFTTEHVRADAHGRAGGTLTLAPEPGDNPVGVSIGGRDLVTFNAVGVGTTVSIMDGDYRTWHLPDGAKVRLGKGGIGQSDRAVAFSPDGQCLAVASSIGIWLYEVATSRALGLLPTASQVNSVAFSPDGTVLASAQDNTVKLWDVVTSEQIAIFSSHTAGVYSVVFSPDGTTLAAGGYQTVELWDVVKGRNVFYWEGEAGQVVFPNAVSFSQDGATLASGFQDGTVKLWDVATGTDIGTLSGHTNLVTSVAFSPDGTTLASGGADGAVRLWDVVTKEQGAIFSGNAGVVNSVAFTFDGTTLATGYGWGSGAVKLWEVSTGIPTATFEGHGGVNSVTFSPDGTTLAMSSREVQWADMATGNVFTSFGHTKVGISVAFSPDGITLASGAADGSLRLWDGATGAPNALLPGHPRGISSLVFSPDGMTLASGGGDGTAKLWDLATGTHVASLPSNANWVTSVAYSPDGMTLASGAVDGTVVLWDVTTAESIGTLSGHSNRITSLTISPLGTLLASASIDGMIKLWDVASREAIGDLSGSYWITSVVFSPDGTMLASGAEFGTKVWDVATREQLATLTSSFTSVVFSPDGNILALGTWPNVQLWDVATREQLATLEGHTSSTYPLYHPTYLAFSPEGSTLASGSEDGTILLWDVQLALPHPRTLTKLSGDEQQGFLNSQLNNSFVVEVRDQNGKVFEGAQVSFLVTSGTGTLSVETTATDARGRASSTLTLGRDPGRNTVTARVGELKPVIFSATGLAIPTTLTRISGDDQQGPVGTPLGDPLVVSVLDQNGSPYAGAEVTFVVTTGEGTLSVETATTDSSGRAAATLTLGSGSGTTIVEVMVADLEPVIFTAVAEATPDFDGDGVASFADFFLFADAFGTADARFDLDGSGVVDFGDFFIFADAFGEPVRAKLLALAAKLIGLPDGPQLQQNAPNPFNSQTVISYFLLASGQARLEVYGLSGQRVAVLQEGPRKAGLHRFRWDGRDDQGRPLASGVYMCRLVTEEGVKTRKLMLLR